MKDGKNTEISGEIWKECERNEKNKGLEREKIRRVGRKFERRKKQKMSRDWEPEKYSLTNLTEFLTVKRENRDRLKVYCNKLFLRNPWVQIPH
jgi:hypothetical protein